MSRVVSDKITFKPYNQNEQWLLPPSLGELAPWWSGFAGGKRTGACARTERERGRGSAVFKSDLCFVEFLTVMKEFRP